MYISPDDAKTDVILAAVAAVLGVSLRSFVGSLPLYPRSGLAGAIADLLWIVALTALVPVLLARYRQDGAAAFGLRATRGALGGLLLAVPAVLLGITVQTIAIGDAGGNPLLGRLSAPLAAGAPLVLGVTLARLALFSLGALLLVGFLAVRSREGFPRSPDMPLKQLVRTIGLGIVAVAAVGGLLRALPAGSVGFAIAVANTLGLAAVLLLADRMVPEGLTVPRTTVVAPVVVVVVSNVFATGGLFRGDLLAGLTTGALAAGVTLAVASLAQTRRGLAAAAPLVVAAHLWPTCLSPLVLVRALEPLGTVC